MLCLQLRTIYKKCSDLFSFRFPFPGKGGGGGGGEAPWPPRWVRLRGTDNDTHNYQDLQSENV